MKIKVLSCILDIENYKCLDMEYFDGLELNRVKKINDKLEIKLQRGLDNFLEEFSTEKGDKYPYHGMWDMEEARWRLKNGNFLFWVLEYQDEIVGWQWDVLGKISVYLNRSDGLVYSPRKKNEFKFIKDIFIDTDEVFGINFYIDKRYRGNSFSRFLKSHHPKLLGELGYKKLKWHTEIWNHSALNMLNKTEGITCKTRLLKIKMNREK